MFKKVLLVAAGAAAGVAGALFLKDRVTLACEDDCCCDCDFSPATAAKAEESASVKTSSLSGEDLVSWRLTVWTRQSLCCWV